MLTAKKKLIPDSKIVVKKRSLPGASPPPTTLIETQDPPQIPAIEKTVLKLEIAPKIEILQQAPEQAPVVVKSTDAGVQTDNHIEFKQLISKQTEMLMLHISDLQSHLDDKISQLLKAINAVNVVNAANSVMPSEEVKETLSEAVKETPSEEVKETPSEEVKETPSEEVKETPSEAVKETPSEAVKEGTPSKELPVVDIDEFNEFFDATFILDITGTAADLATNLHLIGVNNCVIVSPDLPADCPSKDRIVYFIHSAIDTARSEGWKTVNIIANHLKPHKNLFEIMSIALPLIKTTPWNVLQYCTNNHTYEPQQLELDTFNWQHYVVLNPDLPDLTKNSEVRATQDWFGRGHRTGRSATPKLVDTISNNTLAFCIKDACFDEILKNLEAMIKSQREVPLLNVSGPKLMMSPNIFIVPGTGASIMKQLRWLPQLYLET